MSTIDTRNREALDGAVYMAVGRGTEGGTASYRLSIAGITMGQSDPHWGDVGSVKANSGYSLGAIQVDLGQRGTWPVGAISGRPPKPSETSYVDAIITQSSAYAQQHHLPFTDDQTKLRDDLLSHGNGKRHRSSISFLDADTRDGINAWASSEEGKQWMHRNIDHPQIKNATDVAVSTLDQYGKTSRKNIVSKRSASSRKRLIRYPASLKSSKRSWRTAGRMTTSWAKPKRSRNTSTITVASRPPSLPNRISKLTRPQTWPSAWIERTQKSEAQTTTLPLKQRIRTYRKRCDPWVWRHRSQGATRISKQRQTKPCASIKAS